jgi:hypothetical protein
MASPNTIAAIDAAARVLLAHAAEIVAACAMAHPTVVVGVVPVPEEDAVHIHHAARGILPSIAAYEALGTLVIDPRQCRSLADVHARIHLWTEWRRGLLQGDEWRVVPATLPDPDDPPAPAG